MKVTFLNSRIKKVRGTEKNSCSRGAHFTIWKHIDASPPAALPLEKGSGVLQFTWQAMLAERAAEMLP